MKRRELLKNTIITDDIVHAFSSSFIVYIFVITQSAALINITVVMVTEDGADI